MSGPHDPKSLGKVLVAAAGTPAPVKSSSFMVAQATFQSDPNNAGTFMLIKDAAGNIMARITKGQSFTPPQIGPYDLNSLQLDSDTNGDGCFVSFV